MADEPDNLILQHLRTIRSDVTAIREAQAEHTTRLGRLEQGVARVELSLAETKVTVAELSVRFDRANTRLDRIEKRLGLIEA